MNHYPKSDFFKALCYLTFIGSSIAFVGYFLAALFFDKISETIIQYSSWHSVEQISPLYFILLMVLFAISLVGAIRIWKLRRIGLIIYSVAQLLILFLPVFWIGWSGFSTINAIFTSLFITGYTLNLKHLK